ncbi:MAG: tRNA lysidine(34) synthetase TilS [bacterium]
MTFQTILENTQKLICACSQTLVSQAQESQAPLGSHTQAMLVPKTLQNPDTIPTIVLGLSGGPDSVFLFHVLKILHDQNYIKLMCAHLDHGWRPESAQDALSCASLCMKHNIPITIAKLENLGFKPKFNGSQEDIGRKCRRFLFQKTLKKNNANFIALAHHEQDQQETFFLRLLRGSSLSGLVCMKEIDDVYIRPLLSVSKEFMLAWLHENKIAYLQDPSNTSDSYLRNKIRKYVIPALNQCDERFDQKFASTLAHLKTEETYLHALALQAYEQVFTQENNGQLSKFKALDNTLQKRVLLAWLIKNEVQFHVSDSFLNEILRFLLNNRGGAHTVHANWAINKKSDRFWMKPMVETIG